MTHPRIAALAASLFVALAPLSHADSLRLAPAGADDQIITTLVPADPGQLRADIVRTPVAVAWALDPTAALNARPVPFQQESREYWINASQAQLRQGIHLMTTAPGALIRLSPHGRTTTALTMDSLVIQSGGKTMAAREALQSLVDTQALVAAGMDVPEGSVIARLAPGVGHGDIVLAAPAATGDFLVHVFEPNSTDVLRLSTDRSTVVAGMPLLISTELPGATLASAGGTLIAPDGHAQDFVLARQRDGRWQARITPDASHAGGAGLWEVHTFAEGKRSQTHIVRDAKTAFAVARPTARLDGSIEYSTNAARGLSLSLGVEAASASRYDVAGVLYGTAKDGTRQPAAFAQSAAWLEAGKGRITLVFDTASLTAAGLTAPYELRDLRLSNQADRSLLERRERAIALQ